MVGGAVAGAITFLFHKQPIFVPREEYERRRADKGRFVTIAPWVFGLTLTVNALAAPSFLASFLAGSAGFALVLYAGGLFRVYRSSKHGDGESSLSS